MNAETMTSLHEQLAVQDKLIQSLNIANSALETEAGRNGVLDALKKVFLDASVI